MHETRSAGGGKIQPRGACGPGVGEGTTPAKITGAGTQSCIDTEEGKITRSRTGILPGCVGQQDIISRLKKCKEKKTISARHFYLIGSFTTNFKTWYFFRLRSGSEERTLTLLLTMLRSCVTL